MDLRPQMLPVTRRSWLRLAGLRFGRRRDALWTRAASRARRSSRHTARWSTPPTRWDRSAACRPRRSIPPPTFAPGTSRICRPQERDALLQGDAAARRHAAARVPDRRRRSRDRDRARRVLPGLDVQRPGARPDASARPKAIASASRSSTPARTRTRCTFTAGILPRWTARCPNTR